MSRQRWFADALAKRGVPLGPTCNAGRVRIYVTPPRSPTVGPMPIGYGRVSATDQNVDAQRDALQAAS